MLIFGTMYILDTSDRLWRIDDDHQSCNEVTVTDGERFNSVNRSTNHQKNNFEVICDLLLCGFWQRSKFFFLFKFFQADTIVESPQLTSSETNKHATII